MGLMGAAMGLGFIFGPGIGGVLSQLGHGAPFLIAGAVNLVTCAGAVALLKESLKPGSGPPHPLRLPAPWRALDSPLLPFYVVAFSVPFAMAALETTFPLLIQDRFGFGAAEMGWMFLFMGSAVFLVQALLLGRWINAAGEANVLKTGLLINASGFLLVIAATGRVSLTTALVVSGVGNQVMRPTNASLISKRTTLGQGASIGIMDSFDSLGRILGPALAGALYRPDVRYPYLASALILAMVLVGLWLRGPEEVRPAREVVPPDAA
jgi:DHA1 family multidrug resistance protein-like MFS transporter